MVEDLARKIVAGRKGQSPELLRMRETAPRDYDRPVDFRARGSRACWSCSTTKKDAMVDAATEEQSIVKGVPAGAELCFDCSFFSDEEVELAKLITEEDRLRFRAGKELDLAERQEDLKHGQKLVDREDEKWGGC